jgi:putative phosphoserine phosphatase / 1-acylglycerol-3-phosphate O-acyltransferase
MRLDARLDAIRSGPQGPSIGAFFDLDGTTISGYSATALYSHRLRSLEIGPAEVLHTMRASLGGPLSEDRFVELITHGIAGWAGRSEKDIEELGERLFRESIAGNLFHETWRLVKAHQQQGHTVAIATSATRFQAAPLARELEIEHVICTELEAKDGLMTGELAGRTLWGEGKLAGVRSFAEDHHIDLTTAFAYANGDEDIPLLDAIGNPCAVNPQAELAKAAIRRDWPILEFRKRPGKLDPMPAVRTAAIYGTIIGAGAAGIAIGALSRSRRRGIDLATSIVGQVGGALADVDVKVTGERHLWSHRPAVFMINHQSSLIDLLVTTTLLRGGFTAVAKQEAAGIPVIGQLLTMADFAFIDRSSSKQAKEALAQALDRLNAGTSIVISPEGTRSYTPTIRQFKKGGFHLAMQAEVPIVPIVIRNAGELMARSARLARPGTVEVVVLEPIPTAGWTKADLDDAVVRVQNLYRDTLVNWPVQGPVALEAAP